MAFFVSILSAGTSDHAAYEPEIPYDESRAAFPKDRPDLNEIERAKDLDAHRELSDANRKYLSALSDYLVDKRHDDGARKTAARYLGRYGHSIAIPALLAVIRDEEDNIEVRAAAIRALGKIRDKRIVMYIVEEGFGSGHNHLIIASMDALVALSDFPPELQQRKGIVWWGFNPPPGFSSSETKTHTLDPEKLDAYIEIWRQWWQENHEDMTLRRPSGGP